MKLQTLDGQVHSTKTVTEKFTRQNGETITAQRLVLKCGQPATGNSTAAKSTCC